MDSTTSFGVAGKAGTEVFKPGCSAELLKGCRNRAVPRPVKSESLGIGRILRADLFFKY